MRDLLLATGIRDTVIDALVARLGSYAQIATATAAELHSCGVSPKLAEKLAAAMSFGRKAIGADTMRECMGRPEDIWHLLRGRVPSHQEVFYTVAIDVRNGLLDAVEVARGTVCGVEVHPRDVFRPAIRLAAAGIVVAHNHPSNDPTPSNEDIALTRRLREVGVLMGIPVIDHVVIAQSGYRSIAEWLGSDDKVQS